MNQHVLLELVLAAVCFAAYLAAGRGIDVDVADVGQQTVLHPHKRSGT